MSAPYYADEHVTLYHGDCREVTAWLEADVLVTDPPYGMAYQSSPGMGDLDMPWGPAHEDIHLLGRGWDREATGLKREGSVITTRGVRGGAHGDENATCHPTPKPVGLMEHLLVRCPRGIVADPFAGSGATLIAARNQARSAVGVEIEERYCEVIAKRLDQGVLDFGEVSA